MLKRKMYNPAYPTMGYRKRGPIKKARITARVSYGVRPGTKELKFIDSTPSIDPPLNAGFTAPTILNACIAGPLATNRIGRKIKMESLFIRWGFNLAATSVGGSPFRILIVYDKQTNAAAPTITNVLLTDDIDSPMNLSNRDRFVVIMDKLTPPISVASTFAVQGKKFINLKGLETMYNTTEGGTVADVTTGGLFLFACQRGTITVASPNFISTVRVKFSDL